MTQAERSQGREPTALYPRIYSISNKNKYDRQKHKCFWDVERGRYVRLTASSPFVGRLSRQHGILNITEPWRPPRPVTGLVLHLYIYDVRTSEETHYRPPRPVTEIALLLYMWLMYTHRKHSYGPPLSLSGIGLLSYMRMVFVLTADTPVDLHGLLRGLLGFYFFTSIFRHVTHWT
jgi:hypothetical protein